MSTSYENSFTGNYQIKNVDLIRALQLHEQGKYEEALTAHQSIDAVDLDPYEAEIKSADEILIRVKIGEKLDLTKHLSLRSPLAISLFEYARFTWAFWVDHRLAWSSLWRLLWLSLFSRNGLKGQFPGTLFLMGHLLSIRGQERMGFWIANWAYSLMIKNVTRKGIDFYNRNFIEIVLAAFPYTHVVCGRLGPEFDRSIERAEEYLSGEPYFETILYVSSLYGCAYTGDVARAEIYSEKFSQLHRMGKLLRYRPVSKIMALLPFALRGYVEFILSEARSIIRLHNASESDPAVNSQFYRVAALIELTSGNNSAAEIHIQEAMRCRKQTNSFQVWKNFDDRVLELSRRMTTFDPLRDHLLTTPRVQKTSGTMGSFLLEALQLLYVCESSQELESSLSEVLSKHIDCPLHSLESLSTLRMDAKPKLLLESRVLIFDVRDVRRIPYVRDLLANVSPFVKLLFRLWKSQRAALELEKTAALGKLAARVAHDIRSPLCALEMIVSLSGVQEDDHKRILLQASRRIRDIANELLLENRNSMTASSSGRGPEANLILPVVETIVAEKKIRFRTFPKLALALEVEPQVKSVFCRMDVAEVERALSNIIENAAEAMNHDGVVQVNVVANSAGKVLVEVTDRGSGFQSWQLECLGQRPVESQKSEGSGIGLKTAVDSLKAFDAKIIFENRKDTEGASVTIELPQCLPPAWFAKEITIVAKNRVAVVDDDLSVHELWTSRLGSPNVIHFYDLSSFQSWMSDHQDLLISVLMDHEFTNSPSVFGLDVAEKLSPNSQVYLVTSHFSDRSLQLRAQSVGVQIVPKYLAGSIPIEA